MLLSSSSFDDGQEIPRRHGKRHGNVSPALSWEDPPPGTESFAITMVDQDPAARDFVHWLVVDVGSDSTGLAQGAAPGDMPKGSFEAIPYAGPFPPSGVHEYELTLYALSTPRLDLPADPSLAVFLDVAESYALDAASLTGTFTAEG
jgi:Raf kinase inhibitor-like YbhB/YbcL family protein